MTHDEAEAEGHRRVLFSGAQGATVFGSQIAVTALPLLALSLGNATTLEIGILTALATAPNIVISLFIGSAIDRHGVKLFAVLPGLLRAAVLVVSVVVLHYAHGIVTFSVIAVLLGALSAITAISVAPSVSALFRLDSVRDLMVDLSRTRSLAQILGLSLAGIAISAFAENAYLIDAVMCIAASLATAAVFSGSQTATTASTFMSPAAGSMLRSIGEGLRYCMTHREIRPLMVTSSAWNFGQVIISTLLYPFFARDHGFAPFAISLFFALVSIGAFGCSFMLKRLTNWLHNGRTLVFSLTFIALVWIAIIADPWNSRYVTFFGAVIVGALMAAFSTLMSTRQQLIVLPAYQGRTASVGNVATYLLIPVAALIAGILGTAIGSRRAMLIGVIPMIFGALILAMSPVAALRSVSNTPESAV